MTKRLRSLSAILILVCSNFDADDLDGNGKLDFREFRNFLAYLPSMNIKHIFDHWLEATSFDVGEDVVVPQKSRKNEGQVLKSIYSV